MTKTIQNPRVSGALQEAFDLQGRVKPALDEIIIPTVQVADLSTGQIPATRRACSCRFIQPGVAGEKFTARFEIPAGIIAVVQRLFIYPSADLRIFAQFSGFSVGALPNVAQKAVTDQRLTVSGIQPAGVLTYGTQAPFVTNAQWMGFAPLGQGLIYEPNGWVVFGGLQNFGFLELQSGTDNVQVIGHMEWTEYDLLT